MYNRHNDVPVYESRHSEVDAHCYNQVRLALTRLQPELRLSLPGLKHLDLILQQDAWIVVDRVLNDVPIIAWSDFDTKHRTGLHMPVNCRLRFYHAYGGIIVQKALIVMQEILQERLHPPDNLLVAPSPPSAH